MASRWIFNGTGGASRSRKSKKKKQNITKKKRPRNGAATGTAAAAAGDLWSYWLSLAASIIDLWGLIPSEIQFRLSCFFFIWISLVVACPSDRRSSRGRVRSRTAFVGTSCNDRRFGDHQQWSIIKDSALVYSRKNKSIPKSCQYEKKRTRLKNGYALFIFQVTGFIKVRLAIEWSPYSISIETLSRFSMQLNLDW